MNDNLLIITKIKKKIYYLDKMVYNFPLKEKVLKDKLTNNIFDLLENTYLANILSNERLYYQKLLLVKIKVLDFYIQFCCDKKLISYKKYEKIGNYLLDITKLIYGWIKYNETSK